MKKKFLTLPIAVLMAISCAGCGTPASTNGGQTVKEGTTPLYIAFFNAGFGDRWLKKAETRFEEMYKNYSFEEGKRGVDVILDGITSNSDFSLIMDSKRSEVYFCDAYHTQDYIFCSDDITSAVKTSLGESYGVDIEGTPLPGYVGETQSIFDKMSDQAKQYFVLNDKGNEKIIATPYIDVWDTGLSYDAGLFETYALYYKADNTLGGTKEEGDLGTGPDGVAGNADDGLPRTYDEFFAVCDKMKKECSIVPFVWAGNWTPYVRQLAYGLTMSNLGYDKTQELFSGIGSIPDYLTFTSNKGTAYTTKEESFMQATNFIDVLNKSESLYKAIEFMYRIMEGNYCVTENVFTGSYTHELAQADFIFGDRIGRNNGMNYAFLVDGSWWYTEAEKYQKSFEDNYDSRQTRDLRFMPLPKATEASFERTKGENLITTTYATGIAVKKGLSAMKKLLAETFIRFYSTNESLVEYHTIQSVPRDLKCEMTTEQYNALSPFGRSTYDMHNKTNGFETLKFQNEQRTETFAIANPTLLNPDNMFLTETAQFSKLSNPITAFKDYLDAGLTARIYFEGLKR